MQVRRYFSNARRAAWLGLLLWLGLAGPGPAAAQSWQLALSGLSQPGTSGTAAGQATAVDASGNVLVTGQFTGTIRFGSTQLTSQATSSDIFLAKWNVTTHIWDWAVSGGGAGADYGVGVAVLGSSVYVVGDFASGTGASFAGTTLTGVGGQDVFLAKYTDNGASVSNGWAISRGDYRNDRCFGVAATSNGVYLTGGFLDHVLACKYLDNGSSASLAWVINEGSTAYATGLAVSGTSVYVTGTFNSYFSPSDAIAGTTLISSGGYDVFVAKFTDNGSTFSDGWAVSAGGPGSDYGAQLAVSGSSVYIAGNFTGGPTTRFAGTTLPGISQQNVFLAKYTDNGTSVSDGWATSGSSGGALTNAPIGLAVSGSSIYLASYFESFFGASFAGATLPGIGTATPNLVVAKYLDAGPGFLDGWAISAGTTASGNGGSNELGKALAVSGNSVYVTGSLPAPATFGGTVLSNPAATSLDFLAQLLDAPGALPVELSAFTATAAGPAVVHLAWTTASEVNSARFEVERSLDGQVFTPVGQVLAQDSKVTPTAYAYQDALPATPPGPLYYRLRLVDEDGSATYSPVRAVRRGGATAGLLVFPNPAAGPATLAGAAPGARVQVLDALGRAVLTVAADAGGAALLPVPGRSGVYLVRAGNQTARWLVE